MIWHVVSSLKRGAINPPERCDPWIEDELNAAQDQQARLEYAPPLSMEQMWKHQGYSMGYIKRHLSRRKAA